MKTVGATIANREFSKLLGEVGRGETVIVTSHGKPVAQISPVERPVDEREVARREAAWREYLDELARRPAMNLGGWTRDELYDDETP
jgi:prevent-host-death family protein